MKVDDQSIDGLKNRVDQEEAAYVLRHVSSDSFGASTIAAMPNLVLCTMGVAG